MICCVDIVQDISGGDVDAIDQILLKIKDLPHSDRLCPCQRLGQAYVHDVYSCELAGCSSWVGCVVRNRVADECFMSDAEGKIKLAELPKDNVIAEVAPFAYVKPYRILLLMRTPSSVRRREFESYLNAMKQKVGLDVCDVQLRFSLKDGVVNSSVVVKELAFKVNSFPDIPPSDCKTVDIRENISNVNKPDEIKALYLNPQTSIGLKNSAFGLWAGFTGNSHAEEHVSFLCSEVADTEFSDILAYPTMRYYDDKMPALSDLLKDTAIRNQFFCKAVQHAIEKMKLKERYDAKA